MNEIITPNKTMDCRGESCSLMLAKIKGSMEKMTVGGVLEIISTDPCAEFDLPDWSRRSGKELLKMEHVTIFHLRKQH